MNRKKILHTIFSIMLLSIGSIQAQQSSITEAEGESCKGREQSIAQTENLALNYAKKYASELSQTHITSETVVKNFELQSDIVAAFSRAEVKVLEVLSKQWVMPADECFVIRIKAEVIPVQALLPQPKGDELSDPTLPLNVKVWTSSESYTAGDQMRIYLKGNKGFYAKLVYRDAAGNNIQLLPNAFHQENYFEGDRQYEVPAREDNFELTVGVPFGAEKLTLYASTMPLGTIDTVENGPFFVVKTQNVAAKTRGISINAAGTSKKKLVAEFAEAHADVKTSAD